MYLDGAYLRTNPTWHEGDGRWKATQVLRLLSDFDLRPRSVVDIGCGTGGVLEVIASQFPETQLVGYDISPQAVGLVERSGRMQLRVGIPQDVHQHFDLALSLDVFEHVEDYLGFLRSLHALADHFIFHIPLDISAQSVARERPLMAVRSSVGHLHYFTRGTALASLETAGFRVVSDRLLFPCDMPGRELKTRIANIPRSLTRRVAPQLSARLLGGFTLLVLAAST
jgi:SAM-dependent methyltransferase